MPPKPSKQTAPLLLVCGEDDLSVKRRAKQVYQQWTAEIGGMDHEIVDAAVTNSGEALKAISRLREALQTLPFFGTGKAIWFQNCNFLAEERHATAAVTEALGSLAEDLKTFAWENVRLVISSGKVDKRRSFYKTLDKLGTVETFAGLSLDDKDWEMQAESLVRKAATNRNKTFTEEALGELVSRIGPHASQLENEVEKLSLYVGNTPQITPEDVMAVCTANKAARAFALGDALGDRDLPRLLRRLDEELWEVKLDTQKSEIGLLYGLISKVRAMLLLKEMLREGWVKPDLDYARFKSQLEAVPRDRLPEDRRFNPLAINTYVLYKALPQVKRYAQAELIRAMDLLLQCNEALVSSNRDEAMVVQTTLLQIAGSPEPQTLGTGLPRTGVRSRN